MLLFKTFSLQDRQCGTKERCRQLYNNPSLCVLKGENIQTCVLWIQNLLILQTRFCFHELFLNNAPLLSLPYNSFLAMQSFVGQKYSLLILFVGHHEKCDFVISICCCCIINCKLLLSSRILPNPSINILHCNYVAHIQMQNAYFNGNHSPSFVSLLLTYFVFCCA